VRTDVGASLARRAASCVLEPQLDDLVLVAFVDGGRCYILNVLEAAGPTSHLSFDGDVELRVRSGALSIGARDAVRIVTPGDLSLVCSRIELEALDLNVAVESLHYLGRTLRCQLDTLKGVVGSLETVAERYLQIAKRSYRTVAGRDELRAKEIDYAAEEIATIRARNTIVTAEQMLKVDAEQIHLG
jgi:hypothetical protein